jgi:Xaa-Pro aminopeptidase
MEKIKDLMKKKDLDGIIFFKPEAIRYLTDFFVKGYRAASMDIEYIGVIFRDSEPILGYQSGSDTWRIQVYNKIEDYRKLTRGKWAVTIKEIFQDYGIQDGKIAVDLLDFILFKQLNEELPNIEFVDATDIWKDLTAIKGKKEIEIIEEATRIAEIGMRAAIDAVQPGKREYEICAEFEYAMRKEGSEMIPVIPVLASGFNSSINERIGSEKRIRYGELVIIDGGCLYKGYIGEFARTISVGKPSEKQKEIYQIVYNALHSAISISKPGKKCYEIDESARAIIRNSGYKKYMHRWATGHQLGYGLHGDPLIGPEIRDELVPNMIFNLEPRVTLFDQPDIGGVILEDTVQITTKGHKVLTKFEYDEKLLN